MGSSTTLADVFAVAARVLARAWASLLPALSLALATLAAIVPTGLGADWRFVPALFPLAVVHYWADRRRNGPGAPTLPALLIFASGLAVDAMTSGPLGYWALVYLAGAALTHVAGTRLARLGVSRWPRFVAVTALVGSLAWATASLYFANSAPLWPLAVASAVVIAAEPLIAALLAAVTPTVASFRPAFADRRA